MAALEAELVGGGMVMTRADFEHALGRIHPSCSQEDIRRHEQFADTYGAV